MVDKNWRKDLDPLIEENINDLVKETNDYKYAISNAKDKSKAQLWIALAIINHKIKNLEYELKEKEKKIPKEELNKILKTLENL